MKAKDILELAEMLVKSLKGVEKKAALGALKAAEDAVEGDQSTVAILD